MLMRLGRVGGVGRAQRITRKNYAVNSALAGAVVSGALPTGWVIQAANGLVTTVTTLGTVQGMSFIDLRFNGTTSGLFYVLTFGAVNFSPRSSPGWNWTESFYQQLMAGTLTNVTAIFANLRTNAANFDNNFVPSGSLTLAKTSGLTIAGNTWMAPSLAMNFSNGVAIDLTVRFAGIQLERGINSTPWIAT